MTVHIGLLRAVNLGAHNKVAMGDLRGLLARLGMCDTRSLLQSGNLVFRTDASTTARLEGRFEHAAAKDLEEAIRRGDAPSTASCLERLDEAMGIVVEALRLLSPSFGR